MKINIKAIKKLKARFNKQLQGNVDIKKTLVSGEKVDTSVFKRIPSTIPVMGKNQFKNVDRLTWKGICIFCGKEWDRMEDVPEENPFYQCLYIDGEWRHYIIHKGCYLEITQFNKRYIEDNKEKFFAEMI